MSKDAKPVVPQNLVDPKNSKKGESLNLCQSAGPGNKDRRRVPRRTFEAPVGVLLGGEYEIERTLQVGEGGMMIASSRPIEVGRNIVLNFYLPNSSLIVVRAIIRSAKPGEGGEPSRYGIEFMNLGFQAKREIRNFVASATAYEAA